MADGTKIEWTDATVNAINGCSVLSPGCKHCYAMKQAHRFPARQGLTMKTSGGMVWTGEVRFNEKQWLAPLAWKKPRMLFWNAHGDMFHADVPVLWIDRCFAVMALTPQHKHQVLTKRSERMREYLSDPEMPVRVQDVVDNMEPDGFHEFPGHEPWVISDFPLKNVWVGVSVEDQRRANERIPDLLATPAAVRWLSCEPLLGPLDLSKVEMDSAHLPRSCTRDEAWAAEPLTGRTAPIINIGSNEWVLDGGGQMLGKIDWIVGGGESGPGARPMYLAWIRSLRDQCAAARVPFLLKQWGEWAPAGQSITAGHRIHEFGYDEAGSCRLHRVGKKAAGRLLDGVEHNGYPA